MLMSKYVLRSLGVCYLILPLLVFAIVLGYSLRTMLVAISMVAGTVASVILGVHLLEK